MVEKTQELIDKILLNPVYIKKKNRKFVSTFGKVAMR